MPAESKKQQRLFGMVHALQKGDISPKSVSPKVREMAKKVKPTDAKDFAKTKHEGLPAKKAAVDPLVVRAKLISETLNG